MSNPFKTLGIDPALLRGISESAARTLVRAVYQALLKVSHPDQEGGDRERFEAVQAAVHALKDDLAFASALADFTKPRGDQVSKLTADIRKLRQLAKHHEKRATAFALAPHSTELTVRSRGPFQFHVVDLVRTERWSNTFRTDPKTFGYFEMDDCGQLRVTRDGVTTLLNRSLVGTVGQEENIKQLMRDCQPDRPDLLLNGGRRQQIGATGRFTSEAPIGTNRILIRNAAPILRRLRPEICIGAYLFTGLSIEGEDYLYFEGRVDQPPRARSP